MTREDTTAKVIALAQDIEQMNYYQILRVDPKASAGQIKESYHVQSKLFHPDRYFHLPPSQFKECIYRISKRVTEAYVTLRDVKKRAHYDKQLADSEGKALRYTEESEKAQKQAKTDEIGKTDKGRQQYNQGMNEMKRKNFAAAERAFKLALAYEPDNERFKQAVDEARKSIKTDHAVK